MRTARSVPVARVLGFMALFALLQGSCRNSVTTNPPVDYKITFLSFTPDGTKNMAKSLLDVDGSVRSAIDDNHFPAGRYSILGTSEIGESGSKSEFYILLSLAKSIETSIRFNPEKPRVFIFSEKNGWTNADGAVVGGGNGEEKLSFSFDSGESVAHWTIATRTGMCRFD